MICENNTIYNTKIKIRVIGWRKNKLEQRIRTRKAIHMTRIQEIILHKDTGEYIMIEGYPKMPNKYRIMASRWNGFGPTCRCATPRST